MGGLCLFWFWSPSGVTINKRVISEVYLVRAVSIHLIDFGITVAGAYKKDLQTVRVAVPETVECTTLAVTKASPSHSAVAKPRWVIETMFPSEVDQMKVTLDIKFPLASRASTSNC